MKKIINGKKYDTETAKKIAYSSNNVSRRDFSWWEETLYKKKTGEFFLYGEGGPASKYSRGIEMNIWAEGERIIPLTENKAKLWAKRNLDVDKYEEIFGEVEE